MRQETVQTTVPGAEEAVRNLCSKLSDSPDMYQAVVFFASVSWDFEELSKEIKKVFANAEVIGTSTAGEISSNGFMDKTIVLSALSCRISRFKAVMIGDIDKFPLVHKRELEHAAGHCGIQVKGESENNFALVFINAMHNAEESVLAMINEVLGEKNILVAGGSSGDDCQMAQTYVSVNGETLSNGAAVLLCKTPLLIDVRRENLLVPSGKKMTVTAADVERRIIQSLDGQSPKKRYAQVLDVNENQLEAVMVEHPFGRSFGGHTFISAPASFNANGSLNMYSRILPSTTVDVLNYVDAIKRAEKTCSDILEKIPDPQAQFHINCLNRTNYFKSKGITSRIIDVWRKDFPTFAGFTSYGEQINRVNSNQTLVVLTIGE